MKRIPLTKGYETIVSDEDFDALSKIKWCANVKRPGYVYALGYVDGKKVEMHRYLVGVPGLDVDHINGDRLDNRRENLRAVSRSENAINQQTRIALRSSSRRNTQKNGPSRLVLRARRMGQVLGLGTYETIEEAAAALVRFDAHILRMRRAAKAMEVAGAANQARMKSAHLNIDA